MTAKKKMGGVDLLPRPKTNPLYGNVSCHALRPWVAASSFRALGTIVRPATSTFGRPVPATCQLVEPFGSLRTPQSLATYRSPFPEPAESRAIAVAGKSGNAVGPDPSRLVHVAVEGAVRVTSKTWPGVVGLRAL